MLDELLHRTLIAVLTLQMGTTVCNDTHEDTVIDSKEGYFNDASTEDIDKNILLSLLGEPIRNGRCSWFINDSQQVQASNQSFILCQLSLRIIENMLAQWQRHA